MNLVHMVAMNLVKVVAEEFANFGHKIEILYLQFYTKLCTSCTFFVLLIKE